MFCLSFSKGTITEHKHVAKRDPTKTKDVSDAGAKKDIEHETESGEAETLRK